MRDRNAMPCGSDNNEKNREIPFTTLVEMTGCRNVNDSKFQPLEFIVVIRHEMPQGDMLPPKIYHPVEKYSTITIRNALTTLISAVVNRAIISSFDSDGTVYDSCFARILELTIFPLSKLIKC